MRSCTFIVAQLIAQSSVPKWIVAQTSALPGLHRLLFKLAVIRLSLLMLLTMHEDALVGSWATPTVPVADGYCWTTLCALAKVATLIPVITVSGAFTTVVTIKTSPSRV